MSEKLKRYFVFAGEDFYPAGGWEDFRGSFDTEKEAKEYAAGWNGDFRWCHVIDSETGAEVPS